MLPDHLFCGSDGNLYDTRVHAWSTVEPLRKNYKRTFSTICNASELKATLRAGSHAWPGGYPMFLVLSDGEALSYEGARQNLRDLYSAIKDNSDNGWRVIGVGVNYEDQELFCAHTGEKIEAAYGETEDADLEELRELKEHVRYPLPGDFNDTTG